MILEYSPDLLHKKLENSVWLIVMVLKGLNVTFQLIPGFQISVKTQSNAMERNGTQWDAMGRF